MTHIKSASLEQLQNEIDTRLRSKMCRTYIDSIIDFSHIVLDYSQQMQEEEHTIELIDETAVSISRAHSEFLEILHKYKKVLKENIARRAELNKKFEGKE